MKTNPSTLVIAMALLLMAAASSRAAEQTPAPNAQPPAAADPAAKPPEFSTWDEIKNFTFEQRTDFLSGLGRLQEKLEIQVSALKTKRATMKNDTQDWDIAMKELTDAQDYLKSLATEMNDATAETWNNRKERIFRAWRTAQDAIDKVKTSTTS